MIVASRKITDKLWNKHQVTMTEVEQCFWNRSGHSLVDDREKNKTIPPTQWFIAESSQGRLLKVVFIEFDSGEIFIKTAYEPNKKEQEIYQCLNQQN